MSLIDSQFGQLHEKIRAAIAALGGGSIRFLLNTNWHYDHALGNEMFRKSGAAIIAHENSRTRMKNEHYHDVIAGSWLCRSLPLRILRHVLNAARRRIRGWG